MTMSDRLKSARQRAGFTTAAQAARHFGWNPAAYRHHENGTSGFKPASAIAYGDAFGVQADWLLWGKGSAPEPVSVTPTRLASPPRVSRIPILGEVAAGYWREPVQTSYDEELPALQIGIEGYQGIELYALQVVGPSMNLIFPEGRWVIVAPADDVGLREDDVVVVRRSRSGLFETTLKQIALLEDRIVLWPRSTHKDFQEPLFIEPQDHDQDAPEIIGVVVADYGRRERPPKRIELGDSSGSRAAVPDSDRATG